MADLKHVTYCGLYCGLCAQCNRIPQRARGLREAMQKESWDVWAQEMPHFREFWSFLDGLIDSESRCSCRGGQCGPPLCGIRKCAQQKGVDACPFCDDYPCHRIMGLAKGYVMMLEDGKRMRTIGPDAWIEEQEQRRKTGFAYADIRCYPYEVPEE